MSRFSSFEGTQVQIYKIFRDKGQCLEKFLGATYLLACLDQAGGDDKLKDAEEDEEDASDHPHVELGHVGHPDIAYGHKLW